MYKERKSKKKKVLYSDAVTSTDLPPLVQGELRCFLSVIIGKLTWSSSTCKTPICPAYIRLRWWGEVSDGTILRPEMESSEGQVIRSRGKFAVRSGPKQMTSYFNDMERISLEVMASPTAVPLAYVQITSLDTLTSNTPKVGKFPIVSLSSRVIGEVEVELMFKSIHDAFDDKLATKSNEDVVLVPPVKLKPNRSINSSINSVRSRSSSRESRKSKSGRGRQRSSTSRERKSSLKRRSGSNESGRSMKSTKSSTSSRAGRKKNKKKVTPRGVDAQLELEGHNLYEISANLDTTVQDEEKNQIKPSSDDSKKTETRNGDVTKQNMNDEVIKPTDEKATLVSRDLPVEGDAPAKTKRAAVSASGGEGDNNKTIILHHHHNHPPPACHPVAPNPPKTTSDMRMIEMMFGSNMLSHHFNTSRLSDDDDVDMSYLSTPVSWCSEGDNPLHDGELLDNLLYNRVGFYREEVKKLSRQFGATQLADITISDSPKKASLREVSGDELKLRRLKLVRNIRVIVSKLVVATSSNKKQHNHTSLHVDYKLPGFDFVRCHSKGVTDDGGWGVWFDHETVFPIAFDEELVQKWSQTDVAFVLYEENKASKKRRRYEIGVASLPLSLLLQSPNHSLIRRRLEFDSHKQTGDSYSLEVSLELVTGEAMRYEGGNKKVVSEDDGGKTKQVDGSSEIPAKKQVKVLPETQILCFYLSIQHARNLPGVQVGSKLMDPSTYLVTKFFASEQAGRTPTIWSNCNPNYNFNQLVAVEIDASLFGRMNNNYVIVEMWTRCGDDDKLLGITKLPLTIFYQSLANDNLSRCMLASEYPMVACDGYEPVVDLFTGCQRGTVRCLLALGTKKQIETMRKAKEFIDHVTTNPPPPPPHQSPPSLRRPLGGGDAAEVARKERHHVVKVEIGKLSCFKPHDDQIYGETDCFIKYRFPMDTGATEPGEEAMAMGEYRSGTVLCVPEPVFAHSSTHLIRSNLPLRHIIPPDGLVMELWSRFYHPNIRDQLLAKGVVSGEKLAALGIDSPSNPHQSCEERFRISMRFVDGDEDAGKLDVVFRYSHSDNKESASTRDVSDGEARIELEVSQICCGSRFSNCDKNGDEECFFVVKPPRSLLQFDNKQDESSLRSAGFVMTASSGVRLSRRFSLACPNSLKDLRQMLATDEMMGLQVWSRKSGGSERVLGKCQMQLSPLLTTGGSTEDLDEWLPLTTTSSFDDEQPIGGVRVHTKLKGCCASGGESEKEEERKREVKVKLRICDFIVKTTTTTEENRNFSIRYSLLGNHVTVDAKHSSVTIDNNDVTTHVCRADHVESYTARVKPSSPIHLHLAVVDARGDVMLSRGSVTLRSGEHGDGADRVTATMIPCRRDVAASNVVIRSHVTRADERSDGDVTGAKWFHASLHIERACHLVVNEEDDDVGAGEECWVSVGEDEMTRSCRAPLLPTPSRDRRPRQHHVTWNDVMGEVRLPVSVLGGGEERLELKVWRSDKDDDEDVMMGSVTLDCTLLTSPHFTAIDGWYNILTNRSHCRGQLKCSVAPSSDRDQLIVRSHHHHHRHKPHRPPPQLPVQTPSGSFYLPGVASSGVPSRKADENATVRCDDSSGGGISLSEMLERKMKELEEIRRNFDEKIRRLNSPDDEENQQQQVPTDVAAPEEAEVSFEERLSSTMKHHVTNEHHEIDKYYVFDEDKVIDNDDLADQDHSIDDDQSTNDDEVMVVEPKSLNCDVTGIDEDEKEVCNETSCWCDDDDVDATFTVEHSATDICQVSRDNTCEESEKKEEENYEYNDTSENNEDNNTSKNNEDNNTSENNEEVETENANPDGDFEYVEKVEDEARDEIEYDDKDAKGEVVECEGDDSANGDEKEEVCCDEDICDKNCENEEDRAGVEVAVEESDEVDSQQNNDVQWVDQEIASVQSSEDESPVISQQVKENENTTTAKSVSPDEETSRVRWERDEVRAGGDCVRTSNNKMMPPSFFPPSHNLMKEMRSLQEFTNQHKLKIAASSSNPRMTSSPKLESAVGDDSIGSTPRSRRPRRRIVDSKTPEATKRLERIFRTKFAT